MHLSLSWESSMMNSFFDLPVVAPRRRLALAMSLLMVGTAMPALAQTAAAPPPAPADSAANGGLQDIVVTARRVAERLQDVPLSVTAIGGQEARDNHIASVQDLKGTIPNVNVQKSSVPGSGLVQIRGIELGSIPFTGADTRVGIYIDGVYLGRTTGNSLPLADLDRIEVLKGPQGTLFGKNSTAGALNFITKAPTGELGGTVEGGFGNYDRTHLRLVLNTPTFGNFSARASYARDRDGGDIRNLAGGRQYGPFVNPAVGFNSTPTASPRRFNSVDTDSAFLALRYDDGDLTVDYRFDYTKLKDSAAPYQVIGFPGSFVGCIGAALRFGTPIQCGPIAGALGLNTANPFTSAAANAANNVPISTKRQNVVAMDNNGFSKATHWGQSLTIQYVVNDKLTFKSISGYRHLTAHQQVDSDAFDLYGINDAFNAVGANNPPLPAGGVTPYCGSCSEGGLRQHEFTQEFQIIGRPADWLEYIAGAYYFDEKPSQTYFYSANIAPQFTGFGNGIAPLTSGPNTVGNNTFDNGDNSSVHSRSRALFGHVTTHFGNLDLAAGGRYTQDRKRSEIGAVLASRTPDPITGLPVPAVLKVGFNKFTYDASATYKFTPDINAYVRYATAYLAGGAVRNVVFKPETAKAIEGGIKSELFDRHVRLNVAGFYQDSKNAQNSINLPPFGALVLRNQGSLKTSGFEVEAQAVIATGLTVSGNGGYAHQKFSDGQRNSVPKWSAQFAVDYQTQPVWDDAYVAVHFDANYRSHFHSIRFPLTAAGNSDGNIPGTTTPISPLPAAVIAGYATQDAYLAALDKAATNGGYWLANARISLSDISVGTSKGRISAFAQNLFNSKALSQGQNVGIAVSGVFETARRYGVDFTIDF